MFAHHAQIFSCLTVFLKVSFGRGGNKKGILSLICGVCFKVQT